jgi:spore coat protein U-like protein
VTVNCLLGLANVTLSLSTGGANSYAPRAMTGPSSLSYNLFTDAMDTHVWGDGSGSTSTVPLTFGILAPPATVTVYGAIPANQSALAGSYSDTIVVTATY